MTGGLLHDERTALEHILGDGRTEAWLLYRQEPARGEASAGR